MAKRYIGDAVVTITYHDAGDYRGKIVTSQGTWRFEGLYAPAIGLGEGVAYDSSRAYDRMAAAAVSFGSCDPKENGTMFVSDATCWAQDDQGHYEVRRSLNGPSRIS